MPPPTQNNESAVVILSSMFGIGKCLKSLLYNNPTQSCLGWWSSALDSCQYVPNDTTFGLALLGCDTMLIYDTPRVLGRSRKLECSYISRPLPQSLAASHILPPFYQC